jgi:hypothetical protein
MVSKADEAEHIRIIYDSIISNLEIRNAIEVLSDDGRAALAQLIASIEPPIDRESANRSVEIVNTDQQFSV